MLTHPSVGSKLFLGDPKTFGLNQNFFFFKIVLTKLKLIHSEKAIHKNYPLWIWHTRIPTPIWNWSIYLTSSECINFCNISLEIMASLCNFLILKKENFDTNWKLALINCQKESLIYTRGTIMDFNTMFLVTFFSHKHFKGQ